jgi:peptidoglycan hydrolase-like protein with peptidoglycan-binding domain
MILKRGDNNEVVKKIQAVLGVEQIGNFGPKTEEAVKAWQTKNGLKPDGVVGPSTLAKMGIIIESKPAKTSTTSKPSAFTKEQIETAVKSKGYKWFDDKDLLLNIVGVRNSATGQTVTNLFDDWLTLSYKENGEWKTHVWPATTDPGTKGVKQFGNKAGVARLVEGQYIDSHIIRLHAGKYEALGQNKAVKVFRDADRNMVYAEDKTQEGLFGINIHKAGKDSTFVENWSEGCQVFKKEKDFNEFMAICRRARTLNGNKFTYTLIETNDIK